jgi:hypothetical protein
MSSQTNKENGGSRAEEAFREAFKRLKENRPVRLVQGSRVSQNNVAKEAGCDPSALKKSRYPELVSDIKTWLLQNPVHRHLSTQQKVAFQQDTNRKLRKRIEEIAAQRDQLSSLLVQADSKILELSSRVAMLEAMLPENVVAFRSTGDNAL